MKHFLTIAKIAMVFMVFTFFGISETYATENQMEKEKTKSEVEATESEAEAEDEDEKKLSDKFGFSVSLNADQFFGYYPFFQGSYELKEKIDFTFYGILWAGGTGGAWGNWTEFGIGMNFEPVEGFTINPQVGLTHGNLLSSGAVGPAIFGDGIVPNLTIGLGLDKVEGQFYLGYYAPLRDKAPVEGTTLSYLHYWVNAGYIPVPFFSFGVHFEQLINTGGSNVDESTSVYQWFGPYVQVSKPGGGPFARFSAGPDFETGGDSFFKLTAGWSF